MSRYYHDPATPSQLACLKEMGIPIGGVLTKYHANMLIQENRDEWNLLPAKPKQAGFLKKWNCWKPGMLRGEADALIASIMEEINRSEVERLRHEPEDDRVLPVNEEGDELQG